MKSRLPAAVLAALLLASCNRSVPYRSALEEGITDLVLTSAFPHGRVRIMSGLSSQMEATDINQLKFPIQYMQQLQRAQQDGLVEFREEQQGALESIGNMGSRFFEVSPTNKLLKLQYAKKSTYNLIAVQCGTVKVLQILKDEAYQPSLQSSGTGGGDEFRLVLGTILDTPTQQGMALGKMFCLVDEVTEFKFRAILQYNPFAKSYKYVAADIGDPKAPGWMSENVK